MPKWVYKRIRTWNGQKDPVLVRGGVATPTSEQLSEYMLCSDCEARFRDRETIVSRLTYQVDLQCPLLSLPCVHAGPLGRVVAAKGNRDDLVYFAVSIVWRCSVTRNYQLDCHLGPYADRLRPYLLGREPLPPSVAVDLCVLDSAVVTDEHDIWSTFPVTNRYELVHLHTFVVCGMEFGVHAGKLLSGEVHQQSLSGPDAPVYVMRQLPTVNAGKRMAATARPSRRLRSWLEDRG